MSRWLLLPSKVAERAGFWLGLHVVGPACWPLLRLVWDVVPAFRPRIARWAVSDLDADGVALALTEPHASRFTPETRAALVARAGDLGVPVPSNFPRRSKHNQEAQP